MKWYKHILFFSKKCYWSCVRCLIFNYLYCFLNLSCMCNTHGYQMIFINNLFLCFMLSTTSNSYSYMNTHVSNSKYYLGTHKNTHYLFKKYFPSEKKLFKKYLLFNYLFSTFFSFFLVCVPIIIILQRHYYLRYFLCDLRDNFFPNVF